MGVSGIQGIKAAFNRLEQRVKDNVLDAVEETTQNIQRQAISNAPGAGDRIRTTYGSQQINDNIASFIFMKLREGGLIGEVGIDERASKFAIYMEFRTGAEAARYIPTLPVEFQAVARRYYVNGLGKIIGNPFLLPAYFSERDKFIVRLKEALKNAT